MSDTFPARTGARELARQQCDISYRGGGGGLQPYSPF